MVSISEIVGYDSTTGSFLFVETFRWDPVTDTFEFTGRDNSYLMEYKLAPRMGIPLHKKRRIYLEIDRRARIFKNLADKGIKDFYEFLEVLAKAQKEGTL